MHTLDRATYYTPALLVWWNQHTLGPCNISHTQASLSLNINLNRAIYHAHKLHPYATYTWTEQYITHTRFTHIMIQTYTWAEQYITHTRFTHIMIHTYTWAEQYITHTRFTHIMIHTYTWAEQYITHTRFTHIMIHTYTWAEQYTIHTSYASSELLGMRH